MLIVVSPTHLDRDGFMQRAPLAQCLPRLIVGGNVNGSIAFQNQRGVPPVYNDAIAAANDDDTVVFTHDDVFIDDWLLQARLAEALQHFDVVGIAGNRRRIPRQCAWLFREHSGDWDHPFLSGAVLHGRVGSGKPDYFGPTPALVKFIDGVFIAAKIGTLRRAGVMFDPRFIHHFYDMDFCRTCEQAGLKLGTWPIAVTHASSGNFGGAEWEKAYRVYLQKWGE